MQRTLGTALLSCLFPLLVANAQSAPGPVPSAPPAPVVRSSPGQRSAAALQVFDTQPSAGVFVRTDVSNGIEVVSASDALTELRLVTGRATITVHHPANHTQILVDLPHGQVSLFKDGLYTVNAATSTVRVLHGEAEAFPSAQENARGTKVKETQQLSFLPASSALKAVNAYPYELTADLLPGSDRSRGDGPRNSYYGDYEGFYPAYGFYPTYAWNYGFYPYGFYPYGYGYPVGIGFGYFGGFRGGFGGFRGGFRR